MKRSSLMAGAGLAVILVLAYVYHSQRAPRTAPVADSQSVASLKTPFSTKPDEPVANQQAIEAIEQARAEHFEELKTLQEVFALPSAFARREALYALAGRAQPRELDALIAEAEALTSRADRGAALDVLYLSYVERDPQHALQSVLRLPDSEIRRQRLLQIGTAWGRVTPQAALQQVTLESDPATRALLQTAVVYSWAAQDAAQAFDSVVKMPIGWQREQLLRWTTRELVRQNPQRAAELFATLKPSDTDSLYPVLAYEWSRRDVRSAAQWLASQSTRRRAMIGYYVAPVYAAQYPAEALEWAQRVDHTRSRDIWAQTLAGIAEQDPDTALQLAMGAKNQIHRINAVAAIVSSLAMRDPELAMRYLDKLPGGETRSQLTMQIAGQMARTDPKAAISWLAGLPDQNARSNGFQAIGSEVAQRDADAAARLMEDIPPEFQGRWIAQVANGYIQYDVDAGVAWMKKNENAPGYAQASMEFVGNLAMQDAAAAFQFAVRGAQGAQRDQAIFQIVQMAGSQMPEQAARWAEEITDQNLQRQAMAQVAGSWATYDLPSARRWVASLDSAPLRDSCLTQMVASVAGSDEVEALITQIQSTEMRMDAVANAAQQLAYRNL
ncbi:MAG TPA: hypothetical protein VEZ88_02510, partial [Steroidobacteraceae bacterium]|nr:hypothetical protein [Steroidobacteraceae bacterium]